MKYFFHFRGFLVIGIFLCACAAWSQPQAAKDDLSLKMGVADLKAGKLHAAQEELQKSAQIDATNPEIYNLLGFICDQTSRPKQAIHYYQQALAMDPSFTAARNNLGSVYLREKHFILATRQFQATIRSRPYDTTANYNLGLIDLIVGKYSEAAHDLNTAHLASPNDPGILLNLTRAYFGEGKQVDALRIAAQFRRVVGRNPSALFHMGIVLLTNRQYAAAASDLAIPDRKLSPTPAVLLALAQAESEAGQDKAALKKVDQFVELMEASSIEASETDSFLQVAEAILDRLRHTGPASSETQLLLGEVQYLRKEYHLAIETLVPLGLQYMDNSDYLNLIGMCYAEVNQFPRAAKAVSQAIRLEPNRSEFYFNLASIYQKAGQSRAAIAIVDRLAGRGERSPLVLFSLGVSYFNLGSYSTAVQSLTRAIRLKPDFPQAEFFIGRCYAKLSEPLKAIPAYQKAIALDPTFYQADYQLALLKMHLGKASEAVPLLQQVVRINHGYPDAHYQLGKVYAEQGHLSEAISELEDAIALNPGYDAAYYRLGRLYEKTGNLKRARELFRIVTTNQQKKLAAYQQEVSGNSR